MAIFIRSENLVINLISKKFNITSLILALMDVCSYLTAVSLQRDFK